MCMLQTCNFALTFACCAFIWNGGLLASCPFFALHEDMSWKTNKQSNKHIFSCSPFTYFCLSLFLLLFVSHFSFVFCLICLPSANAFHPRVCGLQSLQPSGLQQPPAGRELRRLQQGNELMEGISGKQQ